MLCSCVVVWDGAVPFSKFKRFALNPSSLPCQSDWIGEDERTRAQRRPGSEKRDGDETRGGRRV